MADGPVDFDTLSPEDQRIAQTLAMRQQSGPSAQTAQDLANLPGQTLRDPYGLIPHTPGEGLRTGMGIAQQNLAVTPMRIARGLGAQPGGLGELAGMAGSGLLNLATSPLGTPEGTAITAAMGPLRAGATLLPKLPLPNVAQALGLGAIGGATAAATGGSGLGGAAEGMTAGAVGGLFKRISDHFAQRREDALNLGKAVVKEVPWLGDLIPQRANDPGAGTIGPLLAIRDPAVGQQLLSTKFQQIRDEIIATVGKDTPIDIPALGSAGASNIAKRISSGTGGKLDPFTAQKLYEAATAAGMFQPKAMTIETAFQDLLMAKALARNAPDGATGFVARERARQIQEQINQTIAVSDAVKALGTGVKASLLARYEDAMRQYGKGMAIFDLLGKSQVFQMGGKGGQVDLAKLADFLGKNIDEYGPTRFPDVYRAATRGAPLGAADVPGSFRFPRFYGRGMSEGLPPVSITRRVGTLGAPEMGNPAAGLRPGQMSLMPPEYLLQQPAGGGQTPLGQ